MRTSNAVSALFLGLGTLAQDIDCDGDVKVFNNKDAERLSDSCETIEGNLQLGTGAGFSGDVVISGIERVRGDIDHSACNGSSDEDCDSGVDDAKSWNLTMPDLVEIQGHLVISSRPNTLDHLSLPKLVTVRDEIDVNATHMDFADLERMGGWKLDTSQTKELRLDRLQGFTKDAPRGGVVEITSGWSNNKNEEGISPNVLTNRTLSSGSNSTWPQLTLEVGYQELSENISIAWDKLELLEVHPIEPEEAQGDDATSPITLVLGGVDTSLMNITNFTLAGGIESFSRSENTMVDIVYLEVMSGYQWGDDTFYVDFNDVGRFHIYNMTDIERMALPPIAQDWGEYTLRMHDGCCRSLVMNQTDDQGNDLWYWPDSMNEKSITGCKEMDDEFRSTAEDVPARMSSPVGCRNDAEDESNEGDDEDEEDSALRQSPLTWVTFLLTLPATLTLML